MNDRIKSGDSPILQPTAFQSAVSDVLANRLEAVASEVRAAGTPNAGVFATGETLAMLAHVLQGTLRKIDQIFELDGFVFTPACSLLLELYQARARGSTVSHSALCQSVTCSVSVASRWITVLETMQLVEVMGSEHTAEPRVVLTELGHIKTTEALQLLL